MAAAGDVNGVAHYIEICESESDRKYQEEQTAVAQQRL